MTTTTMATTHEDKTQSLRKRIFEPRRSKGLCFFPPLKDLVVTGEEEDEEEEETRRNKTSRRHQSLKASSSKGGPQFVKGNKRSAMKYLHNCAAHDSSRHGNSGQEEEEEEECQCPEDETTLEEKKGRGRGPRRVRDPQELANLPDKKQLDHERQNREGDAMQAGLPLVTPCVA
ncbi:unnamed protein product [Sphagnum compactum]